jgi:hypothetical protein
MNISTLTQCRMHIQWSEVVPGKQLARQHGPSEQHVKLYSDRGVPNVCDNAVIPSALSLSDDNPSTQQRVTQVLNRKQGALGCRDLKLLHVNVELHPM